jgi:hypothetical protein
VSNKSGHVVFIYMNDYISERSAPSRVTVGDRESIEGVLDLVEHGLVQLHIPCSFAVSVAMMALEQAAEAMFLFPAL